MMLAMANQRIGTSPPWAPKPPIAGKMWGRSPFPACTSQGATIVYGDGEVMAR